MAEENTLVSAYLDVKEGIENWSKLNETEKCSYLCLRLLCNGCPLNSRTESGQCRGCSKIYSYVDSLYLAQSLTNDIDRRKEESNSFEGYQLSENQDRISSLTRLRDSYIDKCNKIVRSVTLGNLDPDKMKPIEEKVKESNPKSKLKVNQPKKTRVWTEEQKKRAVEARRKTWEAKKMKEQEQAGVEDTTLKEKPMVVETQQLELVLAIIAKRIEMADMKIQDLTLRLKSLESEGVMVDYVLPDLGKNQLIEDQEYLLGAQKLINKYLEIKTSDPNG